MKRVIFILSMGVYLNLNANVIIGNGTKIILGIGTTLRLPAGRRLEGRSGGEFRADSATISCSDATGGYEFQIQAGCTIRAFRTTFEHMGNDGIYIMAGAIIGTDDFQLRRCRFINGRVAGQPLLFINCAGGPFTFIGNRFTQGSASYNVRTIADGQGGEASNYYFFTLWEPASNFAGDQYDSDPGDDDPGSDLSQGWITWGVPYFTELISFEAEAGWEEVTLTWMSEIEINTQKYVIERSLREDGGFEPIKEIQAKGEGSSYRYVDKEVTPEITYWYKLTAVNKDLSCKTWGPKKVTPKKYKIIPFTLEQVPNPFDREGGVIIKFSVPGKQPSKTKLQVSLSVYDASGRKVAELIRGEYLPGWYEEKWKPKEAGIYFYRLEVENESLTHKAVVY